MDGAELERETTLTPGAVEPAWRVVSLDDFNGDRKTDIVWQNNDTGQVVRLVHGRHDPHWRDVPQVRLQ